MRRSLNEIRQAAFRATRITEQLRDYASARVAAPHRVDLAAFVQDSAELVDSIVPPQVEVVTEVVGEPPRVMAARLQLHQLLVSLVTNAAEAIGSEPGRICISVGSDTVDSPLLEECVGFPGAGPGVYLFLRVADSGHGMDDATRVRIFDPFYTTREAGRGLGLAAALGIARELRAAIHVDSRQGEGSAFSVFFPSFFPAGSGRPG